MSNYIFEKTPKLSERKDKEFLCSIGGEGLKARVYRLWHVENNLFFHLNSSSLDLFCPYYFGKSDFFLVVFKH